MRLERELEGWKTRGGGVRGSGSWRPGSAWGSGSGGQFVEENGIEVPKRKSSINRQMSMSKGFL